MEFNESHKQVSPHDYLAIVADQINSLIVSNQKNKKKFIEHIQKVIREAEKHGQYLHNEWQNAKKAGWTQYDENKREPEWFLWSCTSWWEHQGFYFSDDKWLNVYFYIRGKPKTDPLNYLDSMIWGRLGQEYEALELLDYQFILLAIIHDAQNLMAGQERIYFNPHQRETLSDRLCQTLWGHLIRYQNSYDFRDVRQTIETAMRTVKANFEQQNSNIRTQDKFEKKHKGIIKRILQVIGAIVIGIITTIITDILGDFGWIERIKTFISHLLIAK